MRRPGWIRRPRPSAEALLVLGAAGTTFFVAGLMVLVLDQPVADFPAWWEATATAAAFAAAALAAAFAANAFHRERERDEEREVDRRRAQASLVAAWVDELLPNRGGVGSLAVHEFGVAGVRIKLRNASPLPVENVEVSVQLTEVTTGGSMTRDLLAHAIGVLPPEDAPTTYDVPVSESGARIRVGGQTVDWQARVDVAFLDAAGVRWIRRSGQPLVEDIAHVPSESGRRLKSRDRRPPRNG